MSRRIRPSARKKTLHNVMCSALSETDKKCIAEVFEKFEFQKDEIIGLINGQETLQKALAESEAKYNEAAKRFYKEGVNDFAERLKNVYTSDKRYDRPNPQTMLSKLFYNITIVAKELRGDAE